MADPSFRYWEDGKHILIESSGWDCFLTNEALNPLVNWLNLHRNDIELGKSCRGVDKINEVEYVSTFKFLTIVTRRDVVTLGESHFKELIAWLKDNKTLLGIREVWP